MGEVLLAFDDLLKRRVALKRLLPAGEDRAAGREAILREARRVGRINDRHIAAIYDVVDLDDEIVIVMEFVDGSTLRDRMLQPVTIDDFFGFAIPCVEGVAAAHAHGLIHRDLKPENLMTTADGQVKILDFGIARRTRAHAGTLTTLTDSRSSDFAGTPQYMAPEAHLGEAVDERADLFSLGVVFYELLTGRRPFEGDTYARVLSQVLHSTPRPVLELNADAGPELSHLVARMMARQPVERFESASDLLRRLQDLRAGEPARRDLAPTGASPARDPTGRARSDLRPLIALSAIAVLAIGGAAWRVSRGAALPRDRRLAILAPATPGASDDFAFWSLGATDLLGSRLRAHTRDRGLQTADFEEGFGERVRSAGDARKVFGSNLALLPTLEENPNQLSARLDLLEPSNERVIASRRIHAPSSDPYGFLDRLYRESARMLRLAPEERESHAVEGARGAGTLRFCLEGRGRMIASKSAEDVRKAVGEIELACKTEPDSPGARASLAAAQLKAHLITRDSTWLVRAEESARAAIALDGRRPDAHRTLGYVLAVKKEVSASCDELARALELDPTDDDLCSRLGRAYNRLGRPDREKALYQAAALRRPQCWQPHWWLATWHYRQGNVDESIAAYRRMIRAAPDLYRGYSYLGGMLVLRGSYPQAIDTLQRSVALRPTRAAFDNLGSAYFNTGRFDAAIAAYNQSFQFGLSDYASWLNLGDAYFWLRGRRAEAAKAYVEAVRLGRDEIQTRTRQGHSFDVMIPANLATVFPKIDQPDSARLYLYQALAADSANPMVQYCAALTHWQLAERDQALTWLEKSVRNGYPVAWLRDSPIFREWRPEPRFQSLVGRVNAEPPQGTSPHRGG
jgi:tetratricopeptide (TPR) repeat protein/tRNA A-37 threonylcarbamoyl transferase component Bud32